MAAFNFLSQSRLKVFCQFLKQFCLLVIANDALNFLAVLEKNHARNRTDVESVRKVGTFVGVERTDCQLICIFLCYLYKYRLLHLARSTPSCKEINKDNTFGSYLFKISLGNRHYSSFAFLFHFGRFRF